MAHHLSAKKRIRQNEQRREHNRYSARSTRNAIKDIRNTKDKDAAAEMLPRIASMVDRLAKMHIIHRNKAANLKSKLAKHVNGL
jgi:small subunit ribosomal protein S20